VTRRGIQRGFLLVEFVVGMGLASVLATIVVSAVFQLNRASSIGTARLQTLTEVQKATIWFTRDIRQASSSDLGDGGAAVGDADFNWTDSVGAPHTCSYVLSGTDLQRTCDSTTIVAAHKVSGLAFSRSGGLVAIGFTVTPDGVTTFSEDVLLRVSMRAR
jgi:Tfp pilus assembly protein FimT